MAKRHDPEEANKTINEALDRANQLYCKNDLMGAFSELEHAQAMTDLATKRAADAEKETHQNWLSRILGK